MKRRAKLGLGIAVPAVIVALVLTLPTLLDSSYQFLQHTECVTGGVVSQELRWTPLYIVDSPPKGSANATAFAPNEPLRWTTATDGESVGVFTLDRWVLYSQHTVWVSGPGQAQSCPNLEAVDASRAGAGPASYGVNATVLLPSGSTSDANVPNSVNLTSDNGTLYPSVEFFASYPAGQTYNDTICGTNGYQSYTLTQSPLEIVVVRFSTPGGSQVALPVVLNGITSLFYLLPAPGSWLIGWANSLNPYGTGLAFEWSGPPDCN